MPTVYVETSIISYLAARPSRDLIVAARQQLTHTWWRERRPVFDLYVSQVVLDEILAGDPDAAERRAALAAGIPVLDTRSRPPRCRSDPPCPLADHGRSGCRTHITTVVPPDRLPDDLELNSHRERGVAATR